MQSVFLHQWPRILALILTFAIGSFEVAMAETRVLEKDGIAVELITDGAGPLVVMIPSLGRPAEDFDDLARHLSQAGFTATRLQPRGLGRSKGPMTKQTLIDLAGDAALVIEQNGGKAVVIGHAFGQRVTRALAGTRPALVRGIVLLAAGGKVPIPDRAAQALLACFDKTLTAEAHLEAVRYAFFADGNDPSVWKDGWHDETARMQREATLATPLERWWGGGAAPMLIVQGLQDKIALPGNGRALKAEFGDRVTLIEIDGAGHALLPEKPKEIADAVTAFAKSLRAAK
jgi:pimeloyl-ACP methyl ester carboxylesterase